ncbi:Phosphatidylinositol:UDP-GlcNAc transferase PIG-C [Rasamsonia emersonii CBS 393.64]|uniref:Phosphatidylinositol:UDP-GlcNAc transferase PIG-C n=1 Tax=Rasamsonia emersonii (strain ATCC 16479 / CBS 393.64 / IMI 116815) TaxID=1408163 RepID=A0A0F4YXH4_RASE3|nr:Phosphatidylinositol:UDP-GlcNAc transferase PIG-C [Rasamsonia emersonii CBS 393.64]KKA22939.1 Phosphatidylinositol:UDP-GlcNAc transferase PIG-C [Rasamsonia emersonii CBS 393.64]
MAPPPHSPAPVPPPVPVETHPNRAGGLKPPPQQRVPPDPTRLAPEHAYYANSPPRVWSETDNQSVHLRPIDNVVSTPAAVAALRPPPAVPGTEPKKSEARKARGSGRRKKRKGQWKKLLWVRQSLQGRVSPVSVVGWGSIGTVLGWILWDFWVWKEQEEAMKAAHAAEGANEVDDGSSSSSTTSSSNPTAAGSQQNGNGGNVHGLGLNLSRTNSDGQMRRQNTGLSGVSATSTQSGNPATPVANSGTNPYHPSNENKKPLLSSRNRQRLATIKSALLIYCALLGLSPILKSLTKSTASDSIWAMSCWLMIINIFSFDYGTGEGAGATKFPASLSTNAALMASTVLASRLPSTTHVFSLTLFSIEVFGLFPFFGVTCAVFPGQATFSSPLPWF